MKRPNPSIDRCLPLIAPPYPSNNLNRDLRKLESGLPLLKALMDLSTAEIKDTAALQEVVAKLCAAIAALPVGEAIMVPGGWDGNVGASTVVHLVERTAASSGLNGA